MNRETTAGARRSRRRPRRIFWSLAALAILAAVAFAALPRALSTRPARDWLLRRGDAALAPGAIEADRIVFSWFAPTRIEGLVLRDARGDAVLDAPRADWDRNLAQILWQRPRLGTLRLDRATIDVERDTDGTIDLYETLRPVLSRDPRTALRIVVREGSLRFRTPESKTPIVDDRADVDIEIGPEIRWGLDLSPRDDGASRLRIAGTFDRLGSIRGEAADLALTLTGRDWPLRWSVADLDGSCVLDGELGARLDEGRWSIRGDLAAATLDAGGAALRGDRVRLDRLVAALDVEQTADGWSLSRLLVDSTLGTLRGSGELAAEAGAAPAVRGRLEGSIDLAAIAGQLPATLRLRPDVAIEAGVAALTVVGCDEPEAPGVVAEAGLSGFLARRGDRTFSQRTPATVRAVVGLSDPDAIRVESISAETPFLRATATPDAAGTLAIDGTFDLGGLQEQLVEIFELGRVRLDGRGTLAGAYRAEGPGYEGHVDISLTGLVVAGLGPIDLHREAVELAVVANGPVGGKMVPSGWSGLRASWESGEASGTLAIDAGAASLDAIARASLSIESHRADVEARLAARSEPSGWAVDRLAVSLIPDPDDLAPGPLRFEASGRYDAATDELRLGSVDTEVNEQALALGPEGLVLAGLASGEPRGAVGLRGDLGALDGWLPEVATGVRAHWSALATARAVEEGTEVGIRIESEDVWTGGGDATSSDVGPIRVDLTAVALEEADRVDVRELVVSTQFAAIEARGGVSEASGRPRLTLEGRLIPDWDALTEAASRRVEPGATLRGRPHPLRLRAEFGGAAGVAVDGVVGIAFDAADLYGLRFGPTSVVARYGSGRLSIEPVDVEVNNGRLHLEPIVERTDGEEGGGGLVVRLGPNSTLSDVAINAEVSHRVLSFIAPVLDNATRVRGRFSADIEEAVLPVLGDATIAVEGRVVFQDVEFLPGTFLDPILGLLNRNDRPLVRLDEPVSWWIADRRVYQSGLTVPIGNLTRIGLEGWVDFDRNLNLTASIPVVPDAVRDRPLLAGVLGGARIKVPVRGTLQAPRVDGEVFAAGMKDLGLSVLERGVTRGAVELLDRITRPRDPDAPRPPTAAERKARRLEKQAERKARRSTPP